MNIQIVHWEGDEWVVQVSGKIVGCTMHRKEAQNIADWLKTAINEIMSLPKQENSIPVCDLDDLYYSKPRSGLS